jgi:hypothetical protein
VSSMRPIHSPTQWAPGFFAGVKRPGPDVDLSLPSIAEDEK